MKKINAFIFLCCYLFMTKMVFSADEMSHVTITVEGKSYECESRELLRFFCDQQKIVIVRPEDGSGWTSISQDPGGFVRIKPVQKISDGKKNYYQTNELTTPYEDTQFNRLQAATLAMESLQSSNDSLAKKFYGIAQKTFSKYTGIQENVKVILNGNKKTYKCTKGKSRVVSLEQLARQSKYNSKIYCPLWACTGSDPSEKILMQLPLPGSTLTAPSVMVMKDGQAQYYKGDFKIYDDSPLPVTSVLKPYDEEDYPNLPPPDIKPDLLIPSKYEASKSSYNYLLWYAKHNFKDEDNSIEMCSSPSKVQDLINEQKKIAASVQKNLSETELIEYLKIIDGSIQSFYVDRKKGQSLGCMYQGKVVDSSVYGEFEHLKEISTLKSTGKYLAPDEVQELFLKAQNMKDIPFGYRYDGCYARAHIMSKRFEEMGIPTQKVWVKGSLFVPGTDIEWNYHVAPTVEVKEKNGNIVNYVIDPSLTNRAVTVDEWVAAMGKKTSGPIIKTTYPFPNNGLDFDRTSVAISPSDVYGPQDLPALTSEDKMTISKERLAVFSEALASQGK